MMLCDVTTRQARSGWGVAQQEDKTTGRLFFFFNKSLSDPPYRFVLSRNYTSYVTVRHCVAPSEPPEG